MIALVGLDSLMACTDSTVIFYDSPTRGAAHNPKIMESYALDYDPFFSMYDPLAPTRKRYISYDSTRLLSPGPYYAPIARSAKYDILDRITQLDGYVKDPGAANERNFSKVFFTYSGNNNFVRVRSYFDSNRVAPPNFLPYADQTSGYNSSGKLVSDSLFNSYWGYDQISRYTYSYNTAGNISEALLYSDYGSGNLDRNLRLRYVYNVYGLLAAVFYDEPMGSNQWFNYATDSFYYKNSNPSFIKKIHIQYDQYIKKYFYTDRIVATLNASGNWDTVTSGYRGGSASDTTEAAITDYTRFIIDYNSSNNYSLISYFTSYGFTGTFNLQPRSYSRHYYENFTPAGINSPETQTASGYNVYPNPATVGFNLTRTDASQAAPYIVNDITGRTFIQGTLAPGQYQMQIPIAGWPRGVYLLSAGKDGQQNIRIAVQ